MGLLHATNRMSIAELLNPADESGYSIWTSEEIFRSVKDSRTEDDDQDDDKQWEPPPPPKQLLKRSSRQSRSLIITLRATQCSCRQTQSVNGNLLEVTFRPSHHNCSTINHHIILSSC
ncbi:hypothetical protein PSHT_10972 [Puccinia striiformis]|uniref:Uncharacterized protein n=1 Tax=Puccinia striiformis TaxID=27350 RepID=A0A2S4V681_9BASI|nr:hypothetical protein PSHT_10972 [Puccinia striiformis]